MTILGGFNPQLASLDFLLQYMRGIFNFQLSLNSAIHKSWLIGKHARVALIRLTLGCSHTLYHEVGIRLLLLIELIPEELHHELGWITGMVRLDIQEPSGVVIVILVILCYLGMLFVLPYGCNLGPLRETFEIQRPMNHLYHLFWDLSRLPRLQSFFKGLCIVLLVVHG